MQPASYVSTHFYGQTVSEILSKVAPNCRLTPADNAIDELLLVKTEAEIGRIRTSCSLAARAFLETTPRIKRDHTEIQAAAMFRSMLGDASPFSALRADGFTYCMSGPNAANAFAAFQISTSRRLAAGDLVLTHCNSHVDGFWTDITRTFCVGEPDDRMTRMYDSVFAAREAALSAIRPGVRARDVDAAARNVLASKGFGSAYKHPTGHGVGFAAIDHNARPCIHPKSDDVLTAGMVFNVEPGIYIDGYGGMRHCDMVAVTSSGMELLTPFQNNPRDLIVSC